ncbi:MAG: pentapeptide repeat-containing protein, partial [Paenibacillus sp.]|nr:pentapeptide repeat-containing protein [Paenibacillus sp.]
VYAPIQSFVSDQERFPLIAGAEIKRSSARTIVGVERLVKQAAGENPLTAIPTLWAEMEPLWNKIAGVADGNSERIGIFSYDPPFGPGQNFRYLAGVEVATDGVPAIPTGMTARTLPEFDILVVAFNGPLSEIGQAWDFFHEHWRQQSGYEAIDDMEYERWASGFPSRNDVDEVVAMELHFPIRLKGTRALSLTAARSYDAKLGAELQDLRYARIQMANFKGAELHGIDMRNTSFQHANFVNATWRHIYFSNVFVDSIQLGGTVFENIKRPNPAESSFEEEAGTDGWINAEPVAFRNSDLSEAVFENCDLSKVRISACRLEGMTIDGIPVDALMKAYQACSGLKN